MSEMKMVETLINRRWSLLLPEHRAARPGWDWWERETLNALWTLIRPGDIVWDVGAEEGDLAVLYASWGARVCLVEASAAAWPWAKAIFDTNGFEPEAAIHAFVGAKRDHQVLTWIPGTCWPAAAAAAEPTVDPAFAYLNERVSVPAPMEPVALLDELFPQRPPAVIVMDIEGAEYQALLGAKRLLVETRPTWMISVHPEMMRERYGDTPDDLLVLLDKHHDYECHYLGYDHEQHWLCKPRYR